MALTKGFKKFVGLVAVVGVVAASIVGYQKYTKSHPKVDVDTEQPSVTSSSSDASASGINYALPASQPEDQVAQPVEQAPQQTAVPTQDTAPSSSGMQALLKAGQK
jgi:hypothetical protein